MYCEREVEKFSNEENQMTSDSLRQIICIENDHDWPTNEDLPTLDELHHWLGCLIRITELSNGSRIELSHFTVKEFLAMSRAEICSPNVLQYLVDYSNCTSSADDCMTYLTHSHFRNIEASTPDEIETFLSHHPFYRYAAITIYEHLSSYNTDIEPSSAIQRFFSIPPTKEFMLWVQCRIFLDPKTESEIQELDIDVELRNYTLSPLHFAAIAGLKNKIKRILANNVAPSVLVHTTYLDIAPLHVAIIMSYNLEFLFRDGTCNDFFHLRYNYFQENQRISQRSLEVTTLLVDLGANINQQLVVKQKPQPDKQTIITPLVLSLLCQNLGVAKFLLDVGAAWDAIAENKLENTIDLCSVKSLLEHEPNWEDMIEIAVELIGHTGMKKALECWRRSRD